MCILDSPEEAQSSVCSRRGHSDSGNYHGGGRCGEEVPDFEGFPVMNLVRARDLGKQGCIACTSG